MRMINIGMRKCITETLPVLKALKREYFYIFVAFGMGTMHILYGFNVDL